MSGSDGDERLALEKSEPLLAWQTELVALIVVLAEATIAISTLGEDG